MTSRSRDDRLFGRLTALRRHLVKCSECSEARKALHVDGMCHDGKMLTLSAADEFDHIIELKRKVLATGENVMYACPDPSEHGKSYALTARPYHVIAIQDGLF